MTEEEMETFRKVNEEEKKCKRGEGRKEKC